MKKIVLLMLITLILSSCGRRSYTWVVDPIFNEYSREKMREGFFVDGLGGSMPNADVCVIKMSFYRAQEVDIPEARRQFVYLLDGLMEKVNNDPKVRPYLHDYPMTAKNFKMGLMYTLKHEYEFMQGGYVAYVTLINEYVYYLYYDENQILQTLYKEPYSEALRIVNEEKSGHNKSNTRLETCDGSASSQVD